ncbi:putative defense protein 3 [Phlebotomus papatasi]|nr:putative defense protein 3 [Phlebotomus papatasi]
MFRKVLLLLSFVVSLTLGLPDGAPPDTCVKNNRPNHGKTTSQPIHTLPYQVVASSNTYSPGSTIHVTISGGDVFRGFFIQARDAQTNEWIGEWQQSANTQTIPECSSITHADPKDKVQATLIWQAPSNKQGQVYFTGAVVKDYGTYWTDIIAQIPVYQH